MMKKVLLVSSNYPDKFNMWCPWNKRANIAISNLKDIDCEVIVPRPYSIPLKIFPYYYFSKIPKIEKSEEGVIHYPRFLYPIPKKIFYSYLGNFYSFSVSKYILNYFDKVNLIHAHHAYPDGYGSIPVCKKWQIPLIIDIHGDNFFSDWLKMEEMRKKIHKVLVFSSKIICISRKIYSSAIKYGLEKEKLCYIPLGVNINKFKPRDKEKIKSKFGIKEEHIFLFVGQLIKRKGVKYLLEAISNLNRMEINNFKIIIIGKGPQKKSLLQLTKKLNIQNLIFFIDQVSESNLLKWYSVADCFILPSLSEGRPTVINEAMSSECAIIASNISGIPEQVNNGHNGFLIEPANSSLLAEKILYLLNNRYELNRMCKNSRNLIINRGLSWEGYADKVKQVYDDSLELG